MVAGGCCRRHGRVDGPAAAVGTYRSKQSERRRARQTSAHHSDADARAEKWRAVHGLSTPGGDNQDQALLQVLLNVIEFGMNPQEAVEAPRFDTQHYVSSFDDHEFLPGSLNVESRVSLKTIQELVEQRAQGKGPGRMGHALSAHSDHLRSEKRCRVGGCRSAAQSLRCRVVTRSHQQSSPTKESPNEKIHAEHGSVLALSLLLVLVLAMQTGATAPPLPNPMLVFYRQRDLMKPVANNSSGTTSMC